MGEKTVTGGHLLCGGIKVNDKLLIGPNNGRYEEVIIRSIKCKNVSLQEISAGSYVCLGLKKYNRNNIRRGNVMISKSSIQILCKEFIADIKVMNTHSTTIRIGYEPVIHISAVRQSTVLLKIENKINFRSNVKSNVKSNDNILRTGDKATVTFRMRYQPEYIIPGMHILLSEGKTKCVGVVKSIS